MKKVAVLFVFFILTYISTNAQELKSKKGESYLPEKGDWSIGFNADGIFKYLGNIFHGNTNDLAPQITNLNSGSIVGKMFISTKEAYRAVANFKIASEKTLFPKYEMDDISGTIKHTGDSTVSMSDFNITAGVGKEFRRGKTRLQGFYGADALLMIGSSGNKEVLVKQKGTSAEITTTTKDKNGLDFGIGAEAFIGGEYFLFPKISMGAQYNFGVKLMLNGKSTQDITLSGPGAVDLPVRSFSENGVKSSGFNIGGVGVTSMSVHLYF